MCSLKVALLGLARARWVRRDAGSSRAARVLSRSRGTFEAGGSTGLLAARPLFGQNEPPIIPMGPQLARVSRVNSIWITKSLPQKEESGTIWAARVAKVAIQIAHIVIKGSFVSTHWTVIGHSLRYGGKRKRALVLSSASFT